VISLTHKGWFGFCPVYLSGVETDGPVIVERHAILLPLFILSELMFAVMFAVAGALVPSYEPLWPIRITGELKPARELDDGI
jgi:uncharacterized membrane protein